MLKEVLVGLNKGPDEYLLLTRVGNGYSEEERKKMLENLEKKKVSSDYIEVSGSNVAFTMVEPDQVIEFSCLDLFTENSKGTISKASLNYKKGTYESNGKRPSASVISPVFVKLRSDKKVGIEDSGISQLTRLVSLEESSIEAIELMESEVISREFMSKKVRGPRWFASLLFGNQ